MVVAKAGQALGLRGTLAAGATFQPQGDGSVPPGTLKRPKGSIIGLPRLPVLNYARGNYSVMAVLTTLFSQVAASRKEYLANHEQVRGFYLVEALIAAVADDALVPDTTTGEVLQITSTTESVEKELQRLQETIQLDQFVNDIIIELLSYGEYNIRMEAEPGKGVVALHDDVDQASIVAMYSHGYPELYLWVNPMTRMLDVLPPWGLVNFALGKYRLRINAEQEIVQAMQAAGSHMDMDIWDELPKYTRVGRPLLYGTLGKIAELQTLEALVPAMKLSRLAAGSIVSVVVPAGQTPEQMLETVKKYEDSLNRKININRDGRQMSVSEITAAAGEIKVIPVQDNRGQLERNDVRGTQEAQDIIAAIQDDRNAICSSIGFPTEILFGQGDEIGKTNILKRYARYVRMLKMVRGAVAHGARQIAMTHLSSKGVAYDPHTIDVRFNNQLIDVEQLEQLEYIDATMSVVEQVGTFLTDLEQDSPGTVDQAARREWLARALGMVVNDIQLVKTDPPDAEPADAPPADDLDVEARRGGQRAGRRALRERHVRAYARQLMRQGPPSVRRALGTGPEARDLVRQILQSDPRWR